MNPILEQKPQTTQKKEGVGGGEQSRRRPRYAGNANTTSGIQQKPRFHRRLMSKRENEAAKGSDFAVASRQTKRLRRSWCPKQGHISDTCIHRINQIHWRGTVTLIRAADNTERNPFVRCLFMTPRSEECRMWRKLLSDQYAGNTDIDIDTPP